MAVITEPRLFGPAASRPGIWGLSRSLQVPAELMPNVKLQYSGGMPIPAKSPFKNKPFEEKT